MVICLYNQPLERCRLGKRLYIWEIVITHDLTIPNLLLESMWQSRWERPFSGGWRFFRSFSSPVPQDEASPCRLASITENETNNHETNPADNDGADGAGTPSHTLRPSRITQKTAEPSHLNVVNCRPVHVFLKPPSRHGRSRIHVEVNWLDRQVEMSEILSCQRSPLGLIEKDI